MKTTACLILAVLALTSCAGYKVSFGLGTVIAGDPYTFDVSVERDAKKPQKVTIP